MAQYGSGSRFTWSWNGNRAQRVFTLASGNIVVGSLQFQGRNKEVLAISGDPQKEQGESWRFKGAYLGPNLTIEQNGVVVGHMSWRLGLGTLKLISGSAYTWHLSPYGLGWSTNEQSDGLLMQFSGNLSTGQRMYNGVITIAINPIDWPDAALLVLVGLYQCVQSIG